MKKRLLSLALALALAFSFVPAAFAEFADVNDSETARSVEVLRLMGVVSGNEYGFYRPTMDLTRSEFCKMAVELLGKGQETLAYRTRTIFPDVRASHWAVGYINYAANYTLSSGGDEKVSPRLIHGLPDGTFAPDRAITFGEAITIVMRILGYTDEMSGGIWPQGYINLAASKGIGNGYNLTGGSSISRGQAARLFVDVLRAKKADGSDFVSNKSELTTLLWIDAGTGKLRTADESYVMAKPTSSTVLNGMRGYVILDENKNAVTFLPLSGGNSGVTNAAIIVKKEHSTDGFSALSGGAQDCIIYRNGMEVSTGSIRVNDVATYNPSNNSIQLCDTRVTVRYENCSPSPANPATITALGGTVFTVLPTAKESVAKFRPGDMMTLLLTASGDIAKAIRPGALVEERANAVGVVGSDGKVQMLCGTILIPLAKGADSPDLLGHAVTIEQRESSGDLKLKEASRNFYYGELDTMTRMLGTGKLSSGVKIFDQGKEIMLANVEEFASTSRVHYAHLNSNGEYDLLILGVPSAQGDVYRGRAIAEEDRKPVEFFGEMPEDMDEEDLEDIIFWHLKIQSDNDKISPEADCYTAVWTGEFVEAVLHTNDDGSTVYTDVHGLKRIETTPDAFIGTSAVVIEDHIYDLPEGIPCFNGDTKLWMNDDLEAALVYADKVNLYLSDNVVRIIEVKG